MIPLSIVWAIGRAAAPAVAESVIHATAMKVGGMGRSRQQEQIAKILNAAAAANELANAVKHMADPNKSIETQKAMARHQISLGEGAKRTDDIRKRAEEAQR